MILYFNIDYTGSVKPGGGGGGILLISSDRDDQMAEETKKISVDQTLTPQKSHNKPRKDCTCLY